MRSARSQESPAKESQPGRYGELEAYRGIAALLIVVFHPYQFSREGLKLQKYVYEDTPLHTLFTNLDTAVAWFFVLSGFLIFLPFARAAIKQSNPQSGRGFLVRRAIRIVPLYYTAILVVWFWRYTGGLEQVLDLLEHLTFTQIFDPKHIFSTIGPAWSLSVEVIFYFFVAGFGPLAYRACSLLARPVARLALLAGTILTLGMGSVIYKWWAFYVANIPQDDFHYFPIYFGPLAKTDTFAIGMLLAVVVAAANGYPLIGGVMPAVLRLIGVGLLAGAFILRTSSTSVELYVHTLSGVAFVLVLASTVLGPRRSLWERMLGHPTLQVLGLLSYSIYMWHEPLMLELSKHNILISTAPTAFPSNVLVLMTVSIAAAALSYWLVERPMTQLRYLFTREGRLAQRYL